MCRTLRPVPDRGLVQGNRAARSVAESGLQGSPPERAGAWLYLAAGLYTRAVAGTGVSMPLIGDSAKSLAAASLIRAGVCDDADAGVLILQQNECLFVSRGSVRRARGV